MRVESRHLDKHRGAATWFVDLMDTCASQVHMNWQLTDHAFLLIAIDYFFKYMHIHHPMFTKNVFKKPYATY